MGGCLNVTIKEKSGKINKLYKHTATLLNFICNYDFLHESEEHLIKYIEDDSFYGEEGACCPVEYGLIFIDLDKKEILTSQAYCGFNNVYLTDLTQWFYNCTINNVEEMLAKNLKDEYFITSDYFRIKKLYENKLLKHVKVNVNKMSFMEFIVYLNVKNHNNFNIIQATLKNNKFKVIDYEEGSAEDIIKMKKDIKSKGIKFTEVEESEWDNRISEILDDY